MLHVWQQGGEESLTSSMLSWQSAVTRRTQDALTSQANTLCCLQKAQQLPDAAQLLMLSIECVMGQTCSETLPSMLCLQGSPDSIAMLACHSLPVLLF